MRWRKGIKNKIMSDEKYCMECGTHAVNTRQFKKGWYMYLCPKCKIMFVGNINTYSLTYYLKLSSIEMRDEFAYFRWDKQHRDSDKYNEETQERKRRLIKEIFGEELLLTLENNI